MVTKTRAQDEDPKGKGVDTVEMEPPWLARFQEEFDRKLSRLQEANDQRFSRLEAMAADLLCRSRKGKKENPEDQICNDEELAEIEAESREGLVHKAILEKESIPQVQVPIANFEVARSIEPEKVDLGLENEEYVMLNENLEQEWVQKNISQRFEVDGDIERDQKMIRDAKIFCAHQLFDQMTSKGKRSKYHKAWKFKFKRKSLVGIKLQIEQYKLSKRRRRLYNKLSTNIKDESMKVMIPGNHPRMLRQLHNSRVQSKMRMMNDSWSMRQPTLKIRKSHRKHKWKSKQLQIASNFWINHSHKLADLVLRTALTDWRTKNSKGLAYDGCVSLEINLAGFGRGKTEMLATSQKMQKMDLFSFGIHTEIEENVELKQLLVAMERFSQEVIEPKMEGGLICGDERFQIKHKWRFKLSLSILELEVDQLLRQFQELFEKRLAEMKLRMIGRVWKSFGYLMEDMMEEDQKLQGDSEPLLTVPDFAAKICETFDQYIRRKGSVGADHETKNNQPTLTFLRSTKQSYLSLRDNRVWDPGGSFSRRCHSMSTFSSLYNSSLHYIYIIFLKKNLEVKVSSKEGDLLQEMDMGWFKRRWATQDGPEVTHQDEE